MTYKNAKTILFAFLLVAMILPFSGMDFAEAKKDDKDTKQDLKNDVKKWLKDPKTKDSKKKSDELKNKFNELLRDSIEEIRVQTGTSTLSEQEIQGAMEYIVAETIKDEKVKLAKESGKSKTLKTVFEEAIGIQYVSAACPTTTNPSYKQVSIDIDGGSYGGYTFAGANSLYLVTYVDNSSKCERTYTLNFNDEDHPYLDKFYDGIRLVQFDRIQDIETFTITNNNSITFDNNAWSNTNDYDCLSWGFACHDSTSKSYSGGTIYVANTWNHMLDTSDTNPLLTKVSVP